MKIKDLSILEVVNSKESKHKQKDKLLLNGKNIMYFSYNLSSIYKGISKLYISNNNISSLTGIDFFQSLIHLSISNNNIHNIYELYKVNNQLESISLKGNFIEKNPNLYSFLLFIYPKLAEIDGYKITTDTYKTINKGNEIKKIIVSLLIILHNKKEELDRISRLFDLNNSILEIYDDKLEGRSEENSNKKILLEKLNLYIEQNDLMLIKSKYLKGNINPSIYVLIKLLSSFFGSLFKKKEKKLEKKGKLDKEYIPLHYKENLNNIDDDINTNLLDTSIFSEVISNHLPDYNTNEIYLSTQYSLFERILKKYDDHHKQEMNISISSLSVYLNYMIFTINKEIFDFFINSIKEDKDIKDYSHILNMEFNDLVIYISKSFEMIFIRYTNKNKDYLKKLSFIHFYILDYTQYRKYIKTDSSHLLYRHSYSTTNNEEYENERCFMENIIETYSKMSFTIKDKEFYSIGKPKLDLDLLDNLLHSFYNSFPYLDFPIFTLNFDYMRNFTSVIQGEIDEFIIFFMTIQRGCLSKGNSSIINSNVNLDKKNKHTNKNKMHEENMSNHIEKRLQILKIKECVNKNNEKEEKIFCINKKTTNEFKIESKVKAKNNRLSIKIQYNKRLSKGIEVYEKLINEYILKLKKRIISEFINNLIRKEYFENVIKLMNTLNEIYFRRWKGTSKYFIKILKLKKTVFEMIRNRKQNQKKMIFSYFVDSIHKENIVKRLVSQRRKSKGYYLIYNFYIEQGYKRRLTSKARLYYYRLLLKKIFLLFKFNLHLASSAGKDEVENLNISFGNNNKIQFNSQKEVNINTHLDDLLNKINSRIEVNEQVCMEKVNLLKQVGVENRITQNENFNLNKDVYQSTTHKKKKKLNFVYDFSGFPSFLRDTKNKIYKNYS